MKITSKFIFLLMTACLSKPVLAQFNVGVVAGLNRANFNGNAPSKSKYSTLNALGGGLLAEYQIADDVIFSIQPMYLQKGTTIAVDVPGEKDPKDSLQVKLNYITVPILFKVISGNGKIYVIGGVNVAFRQDATLKSLENSSDEQDIQDFIESIDLAVNFGLGIMLPIGTPRLFFEVRYSQGLMNISKDVPDPVEKSLPLQFKTTGFQFLAGLLIPIGTGK